MTGNKKRGKTTSRKSRSAKHSGAAVRQHHTVSTGPQAEQLTPQARSNKTGPLWPKYERSDSGNGELFAATYGEKLRYDHKQERWLKWNGNSWQEDSVDEVQILAKRIAHHRRDMAVLINDEDEFLREIKWARTSESRPRRAAMVELAKVEAPISDDGNHWDEDPDLLGVPNGVVDLRTGELRRGRPEERITLQTAVSYNPGASAPRWHEFLAQIFGNDLELIEHVQRVVGYSVTGATSEQVLLMLWGTGANGKSTFLEVLRRVLGRYAVNLPFSVFELRSRSTIPNDIATLVGRRFATANETNESAELNEARIKSLTGSDPITARNLYGEFFTFTPTAKFFLAVNHLPRVSDDSPGMWRRIRVIPFRQNFAGSPEKNLTDILMEEAEGILRWAVKGAKKWYESGLGLPRTVEESSERYKQESDVVGEFLDQRCAVGSGLSAAAADLWQEYRDWCEANGDRPLSRTVFTQRLQAREFRKTRVGKDRTWTWLGVALQRQRGDVVFETSVSQEASAPAAAA